MGAAAAVVMICGLEKLCDLTESLWRCVANDA